MRKAFTFVELIVIIVIIGIIASVGAFALTGVRAKARNTAKIANIEKIRAGLQMYKADNGFYPATSTFVFGQPLVGANGKTYLDKIPADTTDSECTTAYKYSTTDNGFGYNIDYCLSAKLDKLDNGNYIANQSELACLKKLAVVSQNCGDNGCGKYFGPQSQSCSVNLSGCNVTGTQTCRNGVYSECSAVDPCLNKFCGSNVCGASCGTCSGERPYCSDDASQCLAEAECPAEVCGNGTELVCGNDNFVANDYLTLSSSDNASAYESATTYRAIKINNQCWLDKNLNIGFIDKSSNMKNINASSSITKYCYDNIDNNCIDTNAYNYLNGGLYTWAMAMYLPSKYNLERFDSYSGSGANVRRQGVCPKGWHIPSDNEWWVLENYLDSLVVTSTTYLADGLGTAGNAGFRGTTTVTGVGNQLKVAERCTFLGNASCGRSNLKISLSGGWTNLAFASLGLNASLWSSSHWDSTNVWTRGLYSSSAKASRVNIDKLFGLSIRCLKD